MGMNEILSDAYRDTEDSESTVSFLHELNQLKGDLLASGAAMMENPKVGFIRAQTELIQKNIKTADEARSSFQAKLPSYKKWEYIRTEKEVREKLAAAFTEAVTLSTYTKDVCMAHITALDNQYRSIKWQRDTTPEDTKKQLLTMRMNKIKELKWAYEIAFEETNGQLTQFVKLMKNKRDQRVYWLIDNDPRDRYSKDERKKARDQAEKGTPRSYLNATKYLWWGAIDRKDKWTCGITDMHIDQDEKMLQNINKNAKEKEGNDQWTGIVEWSSSSDQTVPAVAGMMDTLLKRIEALTNEMKTAKIDTSHLPETQPLVSRN